MEGWWGFAGVILGAVIAAIVSIGGEWLRGERETRLDSSRRKNDRLIESNRIQRDALAQIQNDLDEWMTGRPGSGDALKRALSRAERVLDDSLRRELLEFMGEAERLTGETPEDLRSRFPADPGARWDGTPAVPRSAARLTIVRRRPLP